ncbi:hypothetical protein [Nocardia huaxiensis]|uniref:Subtilisin inhibitor-like n=1 Tax=Nocardia huaxiensis TaxID=2755382 RepID=A0A7D6ZL97_9NOCA|nr:hypothetical protein [Nocardia huaxiensis]QLY33367.1 hypothetical protein H0264_15035 [Nocardia huaxiensis]UFS99721.1 hypothetical protein LPY97_18495 [Nocardia huaxiensis]
MTRWTRGPLTLLAAGVLLLTACDDDSPSDAAKASTTTTASAPATSPAPFPGPGHEIVHCGTGPWGLAVVVATAKGNEYCPTATAVAAAYAADRDKQPDGDIAVTVDNMRWVCGERQGDPNPYQECASQNESADRIRLVS